MTKKRVKLTALLLAQVSFLVFAGVVGSLVLSDKAYAEDNSVSPGVAGCMAVDVDPAASQEDQQAVCDAAENFFATSCAASGHGKCSSPKTDGTLVDGTHCICLDQSEVADSDVTLETQEESATPSEL